VFERPADYESRRGGLVRTRPLDYLMGGQVSTDPPGRDRKIPAGRLGRLTRLAALGARTGASFVASRTGEAAARQAAEVLGTLRGLAAKLGQMASYVDGMVPEAHRDAYEKALSGLRAAAPTSSPAEIRAVVAAELGAPVDELFAEWSHEPFASASIGQVHRAKLANGRVVAVKVQHPQIARAIESDLRNAAVLERTAGLAIAATGTNIDTRRIYKEVSDRFREELDYVLEAERQEWFRSFHAEDSEIHVPAVVAERSSKRVLTTDLVHGRTLEELGTDAPADRGRYAETLWRFVFRGNLLGRMFNADPHPGNYLFGKPGHVTFLDFGCVQPISLEHNREARGMHVAALRGDERAFHDHVRRMLGTNGGAYEDFTRRYTRRCFEPLFGSPYRITREYVADLVNQVAESKKLFLKKSGVVPLPPGIAMMNRLQFGFYSVLARLDVTVDYANVEREFLSLISSP
jgi:predicted unusual protein kinase regulating ubiquinone biosynthesis (AarF/ABC1/UbiB family)